MIVQAAVEESRARVQLRMGASGFTNEASDRARAVADLMHAVDADSPHIAAAWSHGYSAIQGRHYRKRKRPAEAGRAVQRAGYLPKRYVVNIESMRASCPAVKWSMQLSSV